DAEDHRRPHRRPLLGRPRPEPLPRRPATECDPSRMMTKVSAEGRHSRIAFVLVAALALFACHHESPKSTSGTKPDIILVTIDTLRADSVGFAGNTKVKSPFLEKLAGEGVVFTNAHAHNVVTLPSHTNILTGLYPYQHGVRDNAGFKLPPAVPTLGTYLRRARYATAAFVGAFPLDSRFGLGGGFDRYDDAFPRGSDP